MGDDAAGIDFLLKRLDWETGQKSRYGQFIALWAKHTKGSVIKQKPSRRMNGHWPYRKSLTGFLDDLSDTKELTADIERLK